jgi:hypothetical protein
MNGLMSRPSPNFNQTPRATVPLYHQRMPIALPSYKYGERWIPDSPGEEAHISFVLQASIHNSVEFDLFPPPHR